MLTNNSVSLNDSRLRGTPILQASNRQEFFVKFKGPAESQSMRKTGDITRGCEQCANVFASSIRRRSVEDPRRTARYVPVQVA